MDYIIQEKSILEYVFDFEFDSNVTESKRLTNEIQSIFFQIHFFIPIILHFLSLHRSWHILHGQWPFVWQHSILRQWAAFVSNWNFTISLHHCNMWQLSICYSVSGNRFRGLNFPYFSMIKTFFHFFDFIFFFISFNQTLDTKAHDAFVGEEESIKSNIDRWTISDLISNSIS